MPRSTEIDLANLANGLTPGVTPAMGALVAEAASVVLEHNGHLPGVRLEVESGRKQVFTLQWPPLHENARFAHRDLPRAAEFGAYGIAFQLVLALTPYKVIEQSYKGTGIDYWLGTGDAYPFQRAARLEVSGIIRDSSRLVPRVHVKMKQASRVPNSIPTYVIVVEFGKPQAVMRFR